jgi:hypothetical protein
MKPICPTWFSFVVKIVAMGVATALRVAVAMMALLPVARFACRPPKLARWYPDRKPILGSLKEENLEQIGTHGREPGVPT